MADIRADVKLKDAEEFQDYVTLQLMRRGIVLNNLNSASYQRKYGENTLGIEIKKDLIFRRTNNLWIEVAERHNVNNHYVPSGVCRQDNSWLWLIGDEYTLWIIAKKTLIEIVILSGRKIIENDTKSSRGYLMPIAEADKICLKKIVINKPTERV